MNATGVSLYRLLAPVMVIAVILVGCGSVIFGFLQPYTRYAYRALVFIVTETAWESAIERGSFFSGFGNFTIMANDISDGGRQLNGIFLHEERPNGGSTTTTAEVGRVFRSTDDLGLILRLENGVRVDAGLISKEATVLSFDSLTIPLDASMGPKAFRVRGNTHAELTLPELFQALSPIGPPGNTPSRHVHIVPLPCTDVQCLEYTTGRAACQQVCTKLHKCARAVWGGGETASLTLDPARPSSRGAPARLSSRGAPAHLSSRAYYRELVKYTPVR